MGTTKLLNFQSLRKWRCLIAFFFLSKICASEMEDMLKVNDANSIVAWANATYPGGYERSNFTRGDKTILVIVGMRTSGLATSEIAIFDKLAGDAFALMLWRPAIYGFISVAEVKDDIVFVAKDKVLVVPWSGVVHDMEQMSERRGKK